MALVLIANVRLKTDARTIDDYILRKGVTYILYGRLYIGLGLLQYDPSLSLHDDPEVHNTAQHTHKHTTTHNT
mgnify:CR=1 FL=1